MERPPGLEARASRVAWADVPPGVRAGIEARLGERVVASTTHAGGFSPGLAATLETSSRKRVFAKAVGAERNPDSPAIYRQEAAIVRGLPSRLPVPRLLHEFEDEASGWVVLVFEQVDGSPPRLPWKRSDLDRVLAALTELSTALTPAPVAAPRLSRKLERGLTGWRLLRQRGETRIDSWVRSNLDRICELEDHAAEAGDGETLVHIDVRSDNLVLTSDRVVLVDWPWASIGAAFTDMVFFAPSVEMQGGPRCQELAARHPAFAAAGAEAVNAVIAGWSGFLFRHSLEPPAQNLPGLRDFQRAQAEAAVRWLRERLG
jgi:aminoglycoside phosphotransferase (APT) family kinase protein